MKTKYYIEIMFELAGGEEFFQRFWKEFDSEEEAHQYMNEARAQGWIWPNNAIVWLEKP